MHNTYSIANHASSNILDNESCTLKNNNIITITKHIAYPLTPHTLQ